MSTLSAVNEVPFEIFDFHLDTPEGLESGFYYAIPLAEEDKVAPDEVALAGPYPTKQEAIEAARDFIRDALTDFTQEGDNQ